MNAKPLIRTKPLKRTFRRQEEGFASILVLFVLFVLLWAGVSLASLGSTNLLRAPRELRAAQAFQTATAACDYVIQQLLQNVNSQGQLQGNFIVSLDDIPGDFPVGATGFVQVSVLPGGDSAWVTSNAYVGDIGRSVRVLVNIKDVGIWANAIFAGAGASGRAINGNVDIRGSVHLLGDGEAYSDLNGNGQRDPAEPFQDLNNNGQWDPGEPFTDLNGDFVWNPAEPYNDANRNGIYDPPVTQTDFNSSFSGNAYIGNNYDGIPSELSALIPPLPLKNGLYSLGTEVRVKHGKIGLSGTATVGRASNIGMHKGRVDGTYVNDGWAGNQGANNVFSDNGSNQQYDLGDMVRFPLITGIGAEPYTYQGTVYPTFKDYLDANSLTVPITQLNNSVPAFTYGPDSKGNSIQWVPGSGSNPGVLRVTGIIKIPNDVTVGLKSSPIRYTGRGTLYSTGTINIRGNLLPAAGQTFPTTAALGFVAVHDINLATGNGDSQLKMIGAFYAQGTIRSAKQNQIAGTFVATYYDMGTNVPNIYQVPALKNNLPPGMPGGDPILVIKRQTWRERSATPNH